MREFGLKGDKEMLLLKVVGSPKQQAFFELSGSQISALEINKPLLAAVRNDKFKYKLFQVVYDKATVGKADLMVEVQACKGRVEMYVSEDFATLWNDKNSYNKLASVKGSEQYGNIRYRVKNLASKERLFIGVQSTNELD